MSKTRRSVVVTRRLPEAVETRLSELFDVTLRNDDQPMSREDLVDAMSSSEGQELSAALLKDDGNFVDHARSCAFLVREHEF